MQTYEYRSHQTSLNCTQLELGPDDSHRIVIANRDRGVPNWLDTEGHTSGVDLLALLPRRGAPPAPSSARSSRIVDL